MKSKTRKAAGKASLDPLVRGLTRLQIERAILFVERINHGAAYGHDPELCCASNRVLTAMCHHANAALKGGEAVPSNGVVGGGHCRHKWWHVGWRNKPGEIDVCWCSHCGALRRSGKPGKRRAQFNRPSNAESEAPK